MTGAIAVLPAICAFVGFLAGGGFLTRFSVRTYRLQEQVRAAAQAEGKDWVMWGDPKKMKLYIFRPAGLLDDADSPAVRQAKDVLLEHRRRMNREILKGIACLILGAMLGAAIGVSSAV